MKQPFPKNASGGFTIVELVVAATVMSLVTIGILRFTIQSLNIYHYDTGRIRVNKDIRSFTDQMTTNAVYSNYGLVFPSFTNRTASVNHGQSGDFLVLVASTTYNNTADVTDPLNGKNLVSQMIVYYRDPADPTDPTSQGPVRSLTASIPNVLIGATTNTSASPKVYTFADLLDAYVPTTSAHSNGIVVQLAQGLSNGKLFYNFCDHSIMVKGQIIEQGNEFRRAVNTYNFTVSPRG